jgi:cyanamide hydratase
MAVANGVDNTGAHSHLLHDDTIQDVIKHYPRTGWSSCFASVVRDEITLKPWAHTTVIGGFGEKILANPYSKYD